jgi:hypothetical protein
MKDSFVKMLIGMIGLTLTLALSPAPTMAASISQDVLAGLILNRAR